MSADRAAEIAAAAAIPGYDPDDPLAPIKKAVKDAPDEDLIPGYVTAVLETMAAFGMDVATRATVRAYLKRERSLGVGVRQFDSIMEEARKARKRPAHIYLPPLTPPQTIHTCTPRPHGLLTRTSSPGWCARSGCAWA